MFNNRVQIKHLQLLGKLKEILHTWHCDNREGIWNAISQPPKADSSKIWIYLKKYSVLRTEFTLKKPVFPGSVLWHTESPEAIEGRGPTTV